MKARSVELLDPRLPAMELGESPFWDDKAETLYWVDIKGHAVHRYCIRSGRHEVHSVDGEIGFCIPQDSRLICGMADGIYLENFDGGPRLKLEGTEIPSGVRFNDGKLDPRNRLWAGTIPLNEKEERPVSSLYCLEDPALKEIEKDLYISNGLGWSPDQKILYHVDTKPKIVWRYDYDIETGSVKNRRVFLQIEDEGSPDGMCIDRNGNLYIAMFGGYKVLIFSASGLLQDSIRLPVPNVTSCALNERKNEMFITTARDGLSEKEQKNYPLSGCVFRCEF